MRILRSVFIVLFAVAFHLPSQFAAAEEDTSTDASDPITAFQARLEKREVQLAFRRDGFGYLRDLLAELDIPVESQVLVFSKTSLQQKFIGPATPRAIYFADTVAVGYVQGSPAIEIMVPTATQGYAFYTLENTDPAGPHFTRHQGGDCKRCHGADSFDPGLIVASTPVTQDGMPVFIPSDGPPQLFNFTDQNTPFEDRWSGWYVTGSHGNARHMGNGAQYFDFDGSIRPGREDAQNVVALEPFFATGKYLAPTSDLVALMTLEHQARMTNMLLAAGAAARRNGSLPDSMRDDLLAYMLFVDEAPLPAPVAGTSSFAANFAKRGPRDATGRSLRDFDLGTRLFRYPLSYMIYSRVFEDLPEAARGQIYARLGEILSGTDTSPRFARLSAENRAAISQILHATKAEVQQTWPAQ